MKVSLYRMKRLTDERALHLSAAEAADRANRRGPARYHRRMAKLIEVALIKNGWMLPDDLSP